MPYPKPTDDNDGGTRYQPPGDSKTPWGPSKHRWNWGLIIAILVVIIVAVAIGLAQR